MPVKVDQPDGAHLDAIMIRNETEQGPLFLGDSGAPETDLLKGMKDNTAPSGSVLTFPENGKLELNNMGLPKLATIVNP